MMLNASAGCEAQVIPTQINSAPAHLNSAHERIRAGADKRRNAVNGRAGRGSSRDFECDGLFSTVGSAPLVGYGV